MQQRTIGPRTVSAIGLGGMPMSIEGRPDEARSIATIHAAFEPTLTELDWARTLLAAVPEGSASGAFLFNGRMVDAPLLKKARRIVERATLS